MYYILYTDKDGANKWELVSGEDAMQQRVDEICNENDIKNADDITVIHDDEGTLSYIE